MTPSDLRERVARAMTADEAREYYDYDPHTGEVTYKKRKSQRTPPGTKAGSVSSTGYMQVQHNGGKIGLHRLIWLIVTGDWPDGIIDHIDGNRSNNRWSNLRLADKAQNGWNGKWSAGGTGVRNVQRVGTVYKVQFKHRGSTVYVGCYTSIDEAVTARRLALESLRKEFTNVDVKGKPTS